MHVTLQDRSGFIGTYRWQRLSRPVIVQYLSLPIGGDSIPTANVRSWAILQIHYRLRTRI